MVGKYNSILIFSAKNTRPKRKWQLHNEQLHGSYCLLNIIRVAAVVHVTSMEWKRNVYTLLVVKEGPERRGKHLQDLAVDGIITLNGSVI